MGVHLYRYRDWSGINRRRFGVEKSSGGKLALPVLAVGMGIYLPPSVNMPIVAGAVLAAVLKHIIGKKAENREGRLKTPTVSVRFSRQA